MNTNHHEAIIDRDTFNKVQELFASKQTGKHKTQVFVPNILDLSTPYLTMHSY